MRKMMLQTSKEFSRTLTNQEQMPQGLKQILCQIEAFKTCKTQTWEEETTGNSKLLSILDSQRQRRKMISSKGKGNTSNAWSVKNTPCMWKTTSTARIRSARAMWRHTTCRKLRTPKEHREAGPLQLTGVLAMRIQRWGKELRSMWRNSALIARASLLIKLMSRCSSFKDFAQAASERVELCSIRRPVVRWAATAEFAITALKEITQPPNHASIAGRL